jgi:putative ABC transport system permease protein
MDTLWQDVKYGARVLLKSPGFTAVAVLTLALGIGANTAIFSVVNAVLLRAQPFTEPERLAMVWEHNKPRNRPMNVISPANYLDWREQNSVFEEMAAYIDTTANLTGVEDPEEVRVTYATTNFFTVLRAAPQLGRTFVADDVRLDTTSADGPRAVRTAVVVSHGFWQRRLGGDPAAVNRTIQLNGEPITVVGVMPPAFKLHVRAGSFVSEPTELWMPHMFSEAARQRRGRSWMSIARLKPGVTMQQAHTEMAAMGERLAQEYPDFNKGWTVNVVALPEQMTGEIRFALEILTAAVGFVLLIACANVANLLLARAAAREREVAVRAALGAGAGRVVRQLLTESLLLAVAGGAVGWLVAQWGVDALAALAPRGLLPAGGLALESRVFGFTLGVSLVTGVLFGLLPAWMTSRVNLHESLKEGGRASRSFGTAGAHRARARSIFVVAEVTLALVLLVGAGLLMRSFAKLSAVDPGFRAENVLTLRVQLPGNAYREEPRRIQFFRELTGRIRNLPGVRAVGMNSFAPFTGLAAATTYSVVGRPTPQPGQFPVVDVRVTDAEFFRTMGIPLRRGRLFTEDEMTQVRHVVVVSEALVREQFPNQDPIGQKLVIQMMDDPPASEIIGVVGDVLHVGLDVPVRAMSYWPHPELVYTGMHLLVRAEGNPLALVDAVRRELKQMDANLPLTSIRLMNDWIADSVARARFSTVLLSVFGGLALALAAVGIYGVMAYTVAQRTHEIGIRLALGAQRGDILRLVVRQGMTLALVGVGIGVAAALGVTRLLASMLFQVKPTDPLTIAGVAVGLAAVALIACYVPARRATRVEPVVALRYE